MIEELPPSTPLGKLSEAIYHWRGIEQWPIAEATVYSCEWNEGGRGRGYYSITFSYRANGEMQQGSYYDGGSENTSPPLKLGDTFSIRWNPKHPARFYTGNNNNEQTVIALVLMVPIVGIIFFLILKAT